MSWTFEVGAELGGAQLSMEIVEGERLWVWRVGEGVGKSPSQRAAAEKLRQRLIHAAHGARPKRREEARAHLLAFAHAFRVEDMGQYDREIVDGVLVRGTLAKGCELGPCRPPRPAAPRYRPAAVSRAHGWALMNDPCDYDPPKRPENKGLWRATVTGAVCLQGVADGHSIDINSDKAPMRTATLHTEWAVPLPWPAELDGFRAMAAAGGLVRWGEGRVSLRMLEWDRWHVEAPAEYDPRAEGLICAIPPRGYPLRLAGPQLIVVAEGWGARAPFGIKGPWIPQDEAPAPAAMRVAYLDPVRDRAAMAAAVDETLARLDRRAELEAIMEDW